MNSRIQKKIVRKFFSYYFKRKNISMIIYLSSKPLFKKEGYWVIEQFLNRGYLNLAYIIMEKLPYKKHFDYIVRRVESMIEIRGYGFKIDKVQKNNIQDTHILFCVHNSLPYDYTGYALRTQQIVKLLIKKSFKLMISTRPGYPLDLQKHKELYKNIPMENFMFNTNYIRLKDSDKKFKKGADIEYINMYANALVEVIQKNNISILHAHSNYLNGLAAIIASNKLKLPVIYEIRGLWHNTRTLLDANYKTAGMFTYEANMELAAAVSSDAVVTISKALKDLIVSWGVDEKNIYIVPNTVDTHKFSPCVPDQDIIERYHLQNKVIVGFVGSITSYEGLKELIIAIDALIQDGLDIALLIVGEGREKEKLQKLAKSKNIIFTGQVPFDTIEKYYSVIDICPFPRNNVEICQYVPPLKILEAMSMQKYVIVSDVAPLLEIVEDGYNGLVCKADDVQSLKDAIIELYEKTSLKDTLALNARQWVIEHRSGEKIAEMYTEIYDKFKKNDS